MQSARGRWSETRGSKQDAWRQQTQDGEDGVGLGFLLSKTKYNCKYSLLKPKVCSLIEIAAEWSQHHRDGWDFYLHETDGRRQWSKPEILVELERCKNVAEME